MSSADIGSAIIEVVQMTLQDWAYVGEIATPIVAFVGLFFLWLQIQAGQQTADRASAFENYRQLLLAAQKYPQFIQPEDERLDVTNQKFDEKVDEFRRYEEFVDLMLFTTEEFLDSPSGEPFYEYMKDWSEVHQKYLRSDYFRKHFKNQLSERLQRLVYPQN
jgi:hypothetical protein